ncbi:MAG: hypothetical protein J0I07_18065 [Myxococcales bacterium]|nr:hypothetical protein [Myxococcales bacterium]
MNDPRRLIDDPDVSTSIREALAGERTSESLVDVEAGWTKLRAAASSARVGAVLAEPPATSPPATSTPATAGAKLGLGTSRLLKWGIAISTMAAAGLSWTVLDSPTPTESPTAPQGELAAHEAAGPTLEQPKAPTASEGAAEAPVVSVNALPSAPTAKAPRATTTPRPAALDDDALREELEQIRQIRSLLDRDPAAALALSVDGQRRFSNGHLVEEREGLSVIALARLGRRDAARTKARAFASRYPKSTLVDRIEAELASVP